MKKQFILLAGLFAASMLFCKTGSAQVNGTTVTYVEYNGGKFILQEDGRWKEFAANTTYTFRETHRDDFTVYLYDDNRKINIQFNMDDKVVYYATGSTNWVKLYDIAGAQDVPYGYTKCCEENSVIEVPYPSKYHLAYGANGKFAYRRYESGKKTFDNKTFGDPIPGVVKSGYYKLSPPEARPESGN